MRILDGNIRGSKATYKEVRRPDGKRYHDWRWNLGPRWSAQFGFEVQKDGTVKKPSEADRKKFRNARKRERAEART